MRSLALMHLLAGEDLIDANGRPVDGPALLARGSAVFVQLYPRESSTDPANRILVAPEQAIETRRALVNVDPRYDELREAHRLPSINSWVDRLPALLLSERRERLQAMERAKIESLGLLVRDD